MNIVIFDTETTSLEKPFCYNIGYVISDENGNILLKKDFVVEQIWHNLPLFSTAYYAEKRPIYVKAMRARKTTMKKFGYICKEMKHDFSKFDVSCAYAYNSSFDEKVFNFNCDWYKCVNPFDTIPIYDIRGNAHAFLVDNSYKKFCEENGFFTDCGNYSSTAETVYRFITGNLDWNEEHTALSDSIIEKDILFASVAKGASLCVGYKALRSLGSPSIIKELHLTDVDGSEYDFTYHSIRINKEKTEITLK